MPTTQKIAVIGLGSMGYGISTSALRAGFDTLGADVHCVQVERSRAEGGISGTARSCRKPVDVAIIVVLNAAQTETVLFGAAGSVP